jgi:glycosyltransferase involved in cell wall biosynthesis
MEARGTPPATPHVSVVLPCLNEAQTLGGCIRRAFAALAVAGLEGEIVVADNGSADSSRAIAIANGARVVEVRSRGYGAAILGGIEAARGEIIVIADADDTYDLGQIPEFVARIQGGADFVMGSRSHKGGGTTLAGATPLLHYWVGTPLLTLLMRLAFKVTLTDVNCGLRAFRASIFRGVIFRARGMEFASEQIIVASFLKLKIEEIPTTLRARLATSQSHLRPFRDGLRHLGVILSYAVRPTPVLAKNPASAGGDGLP